MSLLGRLKQALAAKANAAIDKATDPQKEMDLIIADLDEQVLAAKKELLGYKTTEKQLSKDLEACEAKIAAWEKRAMEAVRHSDDELAKEALREQQRLKAQRQDIMKDRNEARSYAIELNRSRKAVETKLQILKLKRGTMAQQLATARSGGNVFGDDNGVWERMQQAEDRIEEQAIAAEVDELLGLDDGAGKSTMAALESQSKVVEADVALAELKAKMQAEKEQKLLAARKSEDGKPK